MLKAAAVAVELAAAAAAAAVAIIRLECPLSRAAASQL